tara:strand:+ start:368 stop:550 length:183 start_codon:yes stop_codon:yes gene_type:complete
MFEKAKSRINALVVISEYNNSVIIHFDGFEDYDDAKQFSQYMTEQLGIDPLHIPSNRTIH